MKSNRLNRRSFIKTTTTTVGSTLAVTSMIRPSISQDQSTPALLGGEKAVKDKFPEWPQITELDETKFMDSLRRKAWCRLYDDITTTFENEWGDALGAKHVVATVNGTNSLYAALYAVGVGPGDEVLVPPYTFVATVNAVLQQFALPVFVDTDPDTFQMDVSSIEEKITEHTRCILPVHLGGTMAEMDKILEIAKKHDIPVVEDACQSHFAEWKSRKAGAVGDIGCFSFQSTKILPCGEGGACVTQSDELYDRIHAFHNNGRDRKLGVPNGYLHQGTNQRMTEFQSALLLAQLTRLEEQCALREKNADYLTQLLSEVPGIRPSGCYDGNNRRTYYLYMLHYDKDEFHGLPIDRFIKALREEGVSCGKGYSYLNNHPFLKTMLESRWFKNIYSEERLKTYWDNNHCPKNDKLSEEGIFMSQTCLLGSTSGLDQIADAFKKVRRHAKKLI